MSTVSANFDPKGRTIDLASYLSRENESYVRIIDSAAKLFCKNGFSAVSMNDVAKSVGLSKAGLYHHCTSKDKLLSDIYFLAGELLLRQLELAATADVSKLERLKRFTVTRMEVVAKYQHFFTIVWQERAHVDAATFKLLTKTSKSYRAKVRELIEDAQRAGEIAKHVDPHLLMLAIDGMTGWAHFWFDPSGRLNATKVGDIFWSFLETGILSTKGR